MRDWLVARGWDDLFLDIDPHRGLVSGQRWLDHLQASAQRCKAVLFVLSRAWLASRYCTAEFWEARKQERPLFAVVVDDIAVSELPSEMSGVWQLAFLTCGSSFEVFSELPPPDYAPTPVRFSHEGLESLRLGLVQAGLTSFDTASFPWPAKGFEHEADGTTPRRPYRGLKPVDVPDAGVFFGRDADLVRARDHLADLRDRGGRCLVVLLGASGSGKSSFLRAGLLPRLARDDRRFLPLPILRPRGAAMWGDEGLLAALETAHRQAGLSVTRAALRADLEAGGAGFLRRLADLRSAAAGDLPKDAKPPTLIVPIDQAEELFTTARGDQPGETGAADAGLFLACLAEILRHGPEALALVTIRSDAYEPLQTAEALAGVPQIPFNLPPLAVADYPRPKRRPSPQTACTSLSRRIANLPAYGAEARMAPGTLAASWKDMKTGSTRRPFPRMAPSSSPRPVTKRSRVWSRSEEGAWLSVTMEGHQDCVRSAAFSKDGTRIVTASDDDTARLWSRGKSGVWTGVALEGHRRAVTSAAFSPDGARIVTASKDGTARVWNVRWLMGPSEWAKAEPLSPPETVCREKLRGSWGKFKDPRMDWFEDRIAERVLTADDIKVAPILNGREGEDVCAPFLEPRP